MIVKKISPRGFCIGVSRAIDLVKKAVNDPLVPKPIYVLGFIVHNKTVVDELTYLGVITLDDSTTSRIKLLDKIKSGTIVLSAHGTSKDAISEIKKRNLNYIDATCFDVYKTHDLIKEHCDNGFEIIYIGKHNHPEAIASLSLCKNIYLVETIDDFKNLPKLNKVFVTNQTTFSINEIKPIHDAIFKVYPDAEVSEEICNATRVRQNAIIETNEDVDLCYIVGDPRSNNSKNLVKISRELTNTKTFLIRNVLEINSEDLKGVKVVSVSSGASTPTKLTKEVISFLENYKPVK